MPPASKPAAGADPSSAPRPAVTAAPLRAISGNPRLAAAATVSVLAGRVAAALVATGAETGSTIDVVAQAAAPLPDDLARLLRELAAENVSPGALPLTGPLLAQMGQRLAELQADVVGELLAAARVSADRLLVLVAHDPGMWSFSGDRASAYAGIVNPFVLAQQTGLNVLDALPARDVAGGGLGGPMTALAEARLLQSRHRSTLLVDMGRTLRATYVPAESLTRGRAEKRPRVLGFQLGPGMRLLDALAQKLSGGTQSSDSGGRLAVQGQQIPDLLAHWQRNPAYDQPLPRWHPAGVACEPFLNDAYQLAVRSSWSVRDLLCTATHLLAHSVADTALRRLPAGYPVDEIVLAGGGVQNGFLMRQLGARLPNLPIVRIAERICPAETLEPAALATLGLMTVDNQPATTPEITGVRTATIAGRLTPGLASSWQRLLAEMASARPVGLALRTAS
ncbi:MAG: anhydro-N-acetylmuramic acid kinase [Planctomycetaceae bacterium]|nr:anhydro-N-acetylmuramic acid kinase [Planctomycetaceae bacterium]